MQPRSYLVIFYDGNYTCAEVIKDHTEDQLIDELAHWEMKRGRQIHATIPLHPDMLTSDDYFVELQGSRFPSMDVGIEHCKINALVMHVLPAEGEG